MAWHEWSFAVAIGIASRTTSLYERLKPTPVRETRTELPGMRLSRHWIASGASRLDAVLAEPADAMGSIARPRSVLLICHGIGEIVEWWLPVQRLMASEGVSSLVFDYTGYGRSTGKISARQFEDDAVAAFRYIETLRPEEPVSVLGFSLGTGVAAAAIGRMPAHRLVLCAGFPSFQQAACRICLPQRWKHLAPPIWRAEESLRGMTLPVLVVHGENDELFPVELGRELHAACGDWAEWLLAPGQGHNQPFNRPEMAYWGPVLRWLAGHGLEWGDRRR
jgi:pimeloyl-ACP methyl ester carboxylesterase